MHKKYMQFFSTRSRGKTSYSPSHALPRNTFPRKYRSTEVTIPCSLSDIGCLSIRRSNILGTDKSSRDLAYDSISPSGFFSVPTVSIAFPSGSRYTMTSSNNCWWRISASERVITVGTHSITFSHYFGKNQISFPGPYIYVTN